MNNRVIIFDTTLRDGEQSPGISLNAKEKLDIAMQLAKLGVDVIEAGFPIASPGDFEAVKTIAKNVKGPVICALARIGAGDIDRAWEAVQYAERPRIHTFVATSDIHLKHKLNKTRAEVLAMVETGVKRAKGYTSDVEFSAEDAFRSDLDFLCQVLETAIAAGATTVNVPDTVGYATPEEYGKFIADINDKVPNIDQAVISVHCHNDLGLAVANSLAAVRNGARQVECAVNGLGERAGNASLEEIVMSLYTRRDSFGYETGINYQEIYRTSRLVSNLTGIAVQPNKAIVGKNAFAHESGIHQDGVIKERTTYEIMNPQMLGIVQSNLVFGKHSGRHGFKQRLEELGYQLTDEEIDKAFKQFKDLADKKKQITDADLEALVENEIRKIPEKWTLEYLHICSGTGVTPTATVRVVSEDEVVEEASCGDGPINAAFRSLERVTGIEAKLQQYSINAVTGGIDAIGEVSVLVEYNHRVFSGHGISTDILEASALAYLNAINKIIYENQVNAGLVG
ncbi:2-isopropylmalate synthase [Dehalobacterium formicoaceticum]|uniref:2-isopropylmalate synthase n=1 Tax=Dehalobacterium formicoaceticum TaxID=51515 RepID=A0ABT1Y0H7_9FIRM|nr:2-isopropylmalate synthase [Dehalobacterium formicoaceticum]MCR6544363.1 2-isopropylmalate synthase [Dehalobacterium formicoaceticum]